MKTIFPLYNENNIFLSNENNLFFCKWKNVIPVLYIENNETILLLIR